MARITTSRASEIADHERLSPEEAAEAVRGEVASWIGVVVREDASGGDTFFLGRRELGHVQGSIADVPFPRRMRDTLVAAGLVRPQYFRPKSGWVTMLMRTHVEVAEVIELFRQNYARATGAPSLAWFEKRWRRLPIRPVVVAG
jgi:hypothetical protein